MNIIDVVLFLVILLSVYAGYQKGFMYGALDLVLLALGLVFAFWSYRYVAVFFEDHLVSLGVWTNPLAFMLCYIFARLLLGALARQLLLKLPRMSRENTLNKVLGIFPGVINGLIYAAITSALLLSMPLFDGLSAKTRDSSIANGLTPPVEWAEEKLAPVFDEAVNHSLNSLTIRPESKKSVDLPFTVKEPKVREDLEAKMLEMVNEERRGKRLRPLAADPEMKAVARAHSRDMFVKGYFSHINQQGESPAERAREAGVRFLTVGENIALAQTLQLAHKGLMNSPGHRANILNPAFGRLGIGIMDGGMHGLMITQDFRNK